MSRVIRSPKTYDVCIIGSGAGGGMAAKILTEGGLNVVLLEAGPPVNPEKDYKDADVALRIAASRRRRRRPRQRKFQRIPRPQRRLGYRRRALHFRARRKFPMVPLPHRRRPHQSLGPHRAALRSRRFHVRHPRRPGRRLAHHLRGHRALLRQSRILHRRFRHQGKRLQRSRRRFSSSAEAALHRNCSSRKPATNSTLSAFPRASRSSPSPLNGRAACHYCGQCGRGCITASNFSSSQVMIPPALKTGRLTLITGAMAREVIVGKDGKAEAVSYIDKATRTEKRINARAFVVAASACESARLLLNSQVHAVSRRPRQFLRHRRPIFNGLRRQRRLGLRSRCSKECRRTITTASAACTCTCRGGSSTARMIFRAAITSNWAAAATCPASACSTTSANEEEGYGATLKKRARETYGTAVGFSGRGEMIPNPAYLLRNRSRTLSISGAFPSCASTCSGAKTKCARPRTCRKPSAPSSKPWAARIRRKTAIDGQYPYGILEGGKIIHEVGTARMGADPKTSVLEQILPGPRREECFCHRRRFARHQSRQESHTDHHGAFLARFRISARRSEERQYLA